MESNSSSSDPIVIVSTVSSVVPNSSVIFLDDSMLLPSSNDHHHQPDILQRALEAAITTTSNFASPAKLDKSANKDNNYVTVFNSTDGTTLRLTPESAQALGISIANDPAANFTPNAILNPSGQMIIEKQEAKSSQQKVILWPSTNAGTSGNVAYLVRPQPLPTPVSVIRPSVISNNHQGGHNNTSLITNVLRPVMTTGIYDTKKDLIPRIPPIILPKPPPVVSVAPTMTLSHSSAPASTPSFIVTSTVPSKVTSVANPNLFGTTKFPIQLVQTGSVFRTLQPLNNSQVTQIAKMLKSRGVKDPQIVYEDKLNNRKLVYKIVCKEDIKIESSSSDISENDEDEEDEDPEEIRTLAAEQQIILNPHDVLKMTDAASMILGKKRKRGRPTDFEKFFMPKVPKKKHSKKLKSQFGLTEAQAQAVEKDIVDDKAIVEVEVKDEANEAIMDEEDGEGGVLSTSRTRSGRLSRPPRAIAPNLIVPSTVGSILDMPNLPPPPPPPDFSKLEPKARRKFTVPAKYRCRVCNKIYLGDRKMSRHMKAYPSHGPSEDFSSPPIVSSSSSSSSSRSEAEKKMSSNPTFTMPIIPLARTQLEELVKNLDAELVLDVVAKKMFDNFSLWDLQLKKMQSNNKDKSGLAKLDIMFKDMEAVLVELKKMVDNCLTHTKLCDKPTASVTLGDHLQLALNAHDGPLFLEQPNHIPEEYHKYFGIQPIISSPLSESNTNPEDTNPDPEEEDSSSMMSGVSDKDHNLNGQIVLERNLGVCGHDGDDDEDEEDSNSKQKIEDSMINQDLPKTTLMNDEDDKQQQRTRLPSFSSIIGTGSPKAELQDILEDNEQAPQVADDDQSAKDSNARPGLDIRRCSLDQNSLLQSLNNATSQTSRRASIDNGLIIRSSLDASSFFPTDMFESVATSTVTSMTFSSQHHPCSAQPQSQPEEQQQQQIPMPRSPPTTKKQDTSSSNFLISDLESVLGSAGDFAFTSPSPEKLMASIPPSSMMIDNDDRPKNQRTDFLGALKSKDDAKDQQQQQQEDLNSFDDSQSNNLIRSTLADVNHFPSTSIVDSKSDGVSERDSLSRLFDEMTEQNNADEHQPK